MKQLELEAKLIDFLNTKEMYLKKDEGLYYIESFKGQKISSPMSLEETYKLADDYLQDYEPGEEPVPVFLDIDDQEEDRSDMSVAELEAIINRFREMTSENRRNIIDALVRASTMMDQEEKMMEPVK